MTDNSKNLTHWAQVATPPQSPGYAVLSDPTSLRLQGQRAKFSRCALTLKGPEVMGDPCHRGCCEVDDGDSQVGGQYRCMGMASWTPVSGM